MVQHPQQLRSFLVPLDGSHLAEAVLPAVERLAARFQATVTLLHVLEQHAPATIHGERHLTDTAEAEVYLGAVADRLRSGGIVVATHVHGAREGDVAQSIVDHAQELSADLIIICTHGGSGLRGLLFGSIAQQVLQRGMAPILLIRPTESGNAPPFDPRRIIVPLDGTPAHEPALATAEVLARVVSAELHLVLVIPTLATLADERAAAGLLLPTTMTAILDLAQHGGVEYLAQIVARCRAEGLAVTAEVLRGDAVPLVLDCAERVDADLMVLASHGRTGLDAILAGSVAPRIAGRVGRPLLLVRAGETAADDR
jgi:nucleotide-binding universal stress UspA family protein